ncbi:hypothetical protein [Haloferula sp. A504]|uniref:hypothetical protein n=1 Tax=Haloferula sp. A504 TaxID=3373601 RepID=UPI0031BE71C8|nr:hypothetical protein [Verrucomicrobiaceae bacterium E54]
MPSLLRTIAALAGPMLLLAGHADAITTTWTGAHDNNWSDYRNWTGGVPGPGDDAVIPSGFANSTDDRTLNSLTVSGGTANIPNLSVGTLNLSAGTLNTGTANVTTAATWSGGSISGAITIPTDVTLAIPSGSVRLLTNATLTNSGTVEMSGGRIEGYQTVVIHNHGTWSLTGHEDPFTQFFSDNTFHNHGLLLKAGGTEIIKLKGGWTYHLGGETRCETGELQFVHTDHHLPAGASLTGAGTIRMLSGNTHLEGAITGTVATLVLDGATLNATGPAAITGTLDWLSGNIAGILTIPVGSRLEVSGAGSKDLRSETELIVAGTYRWAGPAPVRGYQLGRIRIQPGGLCDLAADGDPFNHFFADSELINEGILMKSAGSGGSTICDNWTYRQRGEIRCEASTLEFNSTVVFEGSPTITGSGEVILRNTIRLLGDATFSAPTSWTAGTWIGGGGSLQGMLIWSGGESQGDWTVNAGATLRIVDGTGALKRLGTGARIESAGTIELASGSLNGYENATIRILSGGTLAATGTAVMDEFFGGTNHLEILPDGELATTATADLRVDWRLDNQGAVLTPAGRLVANHGGLSSGLFESTGTGALHFAAGTMTLNGGAEIRGPGEVELSGGTLSAEAPVEVFCHLAGGTARGAETGELRFKDGSLWSSGFLEGNLRVPAGATLTVSGPPETLRDMNTLSRLVIDGRLLWQGPGAIRGYDRALVEITPTGVMELTGDGEVFTQFYGGNQLVNRGTLRRSAGSGDASIRHFACTNNGAIDAASGRLVFHSPLDLENGGILSGGGRTVAAADTTRLLGTTHVDNSIFELAGATLASDPADNGRLTGGTIEWSAGFIAGTVTLDAIAATTGNGFRELTTSAELRNAGTLTLGGSGEIRTFDQAVLRNLPGATLHATGGVRLTRFFDTNSVINEGTMTIGSSPGRMIIDSPFVQTATGRLEVGVAGPDPATPQFDILQINASATLAGTLVANVEGGYNPANGTPFEILTSSARSGGFDQVIASHFDVTYPTTGDPPVSQNNVVLVAKEFSALDYETWTANHSLTGDDALPGTDRDRDGSANLVEYALNMNPNAPDLPPLASEVGSVSGSDWLILRYRRWNDRVNAGLVYRPETSLNLIAWLPTGLIDEADPDAVEVPGSEARRCRVPQAGGTAFLRLAFELPD